MTPALAPALRLARWREGGRTRGGVEFADIAEAHLDGVYRFVRQLVRDADVAEDVTAATFEKALRTWSSYDPRRAKPLTWLCSIARNVAIDHWRREERRRARQRAIPHEPAAAPAAPLDGLAPELAGALETLSQIEREVLVLRVVLELSSEETASVVGISPTACSSCLHRTLNKVRERIDSDG